VERRVEAQDVEGEVGAEGVRRRPADVLGEPDLAEVDGLGRPASQRSVKRASPASARSMKARMTWGAPSWRPMPASRSMPRTSVRRPWGRR
jgi:hypothetical protein